ncbi:unnamed protein product [Rotaria socialis]|uniref:EF-hand domain-containing protein n=1 Tax=Rotaria socialis TaxID=392032 RepID=A0A820V6I1_9BILA|nr:unnamed protein product [Rotaria socialis]CAF4495386.1 unnamed protein product [Rotaria socialis]
MSWYDNETSPIKVSSVAPPVIDPPMNHSITRSSVFKWDTFRVLLDNNLILTEKGIEMLKINTNLTDNQIREWHAGILRDCPNGKLSKTKFVAGYEQLYPGGKANEFCKNVFATFDRDNTGTIEFYEFILAIGLTKSNNLDLRFSLALDMHNSNDTETMDVNELAKAISTLYDFMSVIDRKNDYDPKHRVEEIIRMCDVTGNKKLTRKEFLIGCQKDPVIRRLLVPDA